MRSQVQILPLPLVTRPLLRIAIVSPTRQTLSIAENARELHNADVLLFRRRGIIAIAGRGEYSHAAMLAWWDSTPFLLEMRELRGGRAVTLKSQVQAYPGMIDVYRVASPVWSIKNAAVKAMKLKAGNRYSYANVLSAAALHLPFIRLIAKPDTNDVTATPDADDIPEFCSEAVANAYRWAGLDLVPNLADKVTEPSDLARSAVLAYQFTLEP